MVFIYYQSPALQVAASYCKQNSFVVSLWMLREWYNILRIKKNPAHLLLIIIYYISHRFRRITANEGRQRTVFSAEDN